MNVINNTYLELFGQDSKVKPDRRLGYVGISTDDYFIGCRPDGVIIICSGSKADTLVRHIEGITNVSRIDIALTIWHLEDIGNSILPLADIASVYRDNLSLPKPYKVTAYRGYGSGDTLYIGSGSSDKYFRLYDKYRESRLEKQYKNALRYEVEYKHKTAQQVYKELAKQQFNAQVMSDTIQDHCLNKGIVITDILSTEQQIDSKTLKTRSSDDRRLEWLNASVNPALESLLQRRPIDEVIMALGLQDRVKPV